MTRTVIPMTEPDLKTAVVGMARAFGWRVHHDRPARTEKGWRTPVEGDAGFPDLVLARDGRILIVELKSARGRLTQEQTGWLEALTGERYRDNADWGDGYAVGLEPDSWGGGSTVDVHIWRPGHLRDGTIERKLRNA